MFILYFLGFVIGTGLSVIGIYMLAILAHNYVNKN